MRIASETANERTIFRMSERIHPAKEFEQFAIAGQKPGKLGVFEIDAYSKFDGKGT